MINNKPDPISGLYLPTLVELATLLKEVTDQALFKVVSLHHSSRHLVNAKVSLAVIIPNPMPLDQVVPGTVSDMICSHQQISSLVVLESMTVDGGLEQWSQTNSLSNFNQQSSDRQQCTKTLTECNVLRFSCGERNL